MRLRLPLLSLLISLPLLSAVASGQAIDFTSDIKPILSDRCFVCHGPDEENRQADLRLDEKSGITKAAEFGEAEKVVTPGDPEASELWLRVSSDDPDLRMPPPDSNLQLTPEEISLLREWIGQGAKYAEHWAFQAIAPPAIPAGAPLAPIDHWIEAQLRESGFSLGAEATKHQLVRRLSFDLTGLPPSLDELADFLADESESAYTKLVDRLLDSSRYGERMASQWLDVARYSDTYGYQVDRDRFVWPYRDWVIRAFNRNLPYDQFITEQLAGDLLPDATEEQLLATTFNRLHPQKVEGGSVPEEFRIEYVADRTQTFATALLGLTLECARCHDHKYDPISQREYYQLTAFFDKIDEAGLYSYFTPKAVPTPTLLLTEEDSQTKLEASQERRIGAERKLGQRRTELLATYAGQPDITVARPEPIESVSFETDEVSGRNTLVDGIRGKSIRLSGDDAFNLKQGNFHRYDPFSISLWLKIPDRFDRAVVFHRSPAWTDAASRGYECLIEEGFLSTSLIHFWPGNAISVRATSPFPINQWHHVAITYDGSSRAAGLRVFVDGEPIATQVVRDNLYKDITGGGNDHVTIGQRFRDMGLKGGHVDEFQIFDRQLSAAEIRLVSDQDPSRISSAEAIEHVVTTDSRYVELLESVREARKAEDESQAALAEIMVMREMSPPRDTFVLERGAYDKRGDSVVADTPKALPAMDSSFPRNRLGLARWLTNPQHPLTARVAVNRIWQLLFGQGLVRTPEDFGSQGQLPTHPALLDWLANDFIEHGWDTKRLIKRIVSSRTYRQTSVASSALLEFDPENRLYGRAPSYRLPAEMLRDQALSVSGLLVDRIGGPPVKPYDLEVSFKPAKPDEGEGLYRRSVYTYWKRTGPAPVMMALDAAKRDVCRVKRSQTSSPLQTLVLMNSPQFVEAARALAERTMTEQSDVEAQLNVIFQSLIGRPPTEAEEAILLALYQEQLRRFEDGDSSISEYLSVAAKSPNADSQTAELAALTAVANTLFGLDECMMKR